MLGDFINMIAIGRDVRHAGRVSQIIRNAGAYHGRPIYGYSFRISGNADDLHSASESKEAQYLSVKSPTFRMQNEKGTIIVRGIAIVQKSFQNADVVRLDGVDHQKYIGDLVERGKGELIVAL